MEDLSGNSSDKASFHVAVRKMNAFYNDIHVVFNQKNGLAYCGM